MTTRKTNAAVAAKFGISARTVSRMRGRTREAYIAECREVQRKAAALRDTGMRWREVGEALGITENAARAAGQRARGAWSDGTQQPARDTETADLFSA